MYNDGFGSFGFGGFEAMFSLVFLLILCSMVYFLIRGISRWNKNNKSPVLTVPARVVAKRQEISHHHHGDASMHHAHHTNTRHYATFEFESGDRLELPLDDGEYGMLVEGDTGKLTFQGTRYLGFERTI